MTESVVLLGHGSHLNPQSSNPVRRHANRLRERGRFDEVRVAFWKEEPSFRDVLRTVEGDKVYAVPIFTSEGYFVDEVVPRELGLPRDGVAYTSPVGTHPSMIDVVVDRARSVYDGPTQDAALVLVGHGTERNPNSANAVYQHAGRADQKGVFAEVEAVFMDEKPYVENLSDHVEASDVVVVPFFVSDGYHTQEDIPADIDIVAEEGDGYEVPATTGDKRVWYTGAVGTDVGVVDVILENINETDLPEGVHTSQASDAVGWFAEEIDDGGTDWGELSVIPRSDGYEIRHVDDTDEDKLKMVDSVQKLRLLVDHDDGGLYRPMDGETTLPTGWRFVASDVGEAVEAVRRVYPVTVVDAYLSERGEIDTTPWSETARRQTGRYAGVDTLAGEPLRCAVRAVCSRCVRSPEWTDKEGGKGDSPPCSEACSFFVACAREFVEHESTENDGTENPKSRSETPRRGDVSNPANEYRRRYAAAEEGS